MKWPWHKPKPEPELTPAQQVRHYSADLARLANELKRISEDLRRQEGLPR